jgi:putative tryptophan/tyrosine transport system substrate-binding protein
MKRREFITLLGGTAATWPLAAPAQQPILPLVGFMDLSTTRTFMQAAIRKGLGEAGYIEGESVTTEYHWAEGHDDRLPAIAAEMIRQQVSVIVAGGTPSALVAKAATATIPVIFEIAGDPVKLGLVTSLNRPGRNVTGVTQLSSELVSKRLGLLHDLIPTASIVCFLVIQSIREQRPK